MVLNTALKKAPTGLGPNNAAEESLQETVKSLAELTTRKRARDAAFALINAEMRTKWFETVEDDAEEIK